MQPRSTNASIQVKPEIVTRERIGELRSHPSARKVGYGWLSIARPEAFPGQVLLVSTLAPVSVTFPHGSADLDQMRASLSAGLYASKNPQQTCNDVEAIESGDVATPNHIVEGSSQ